MPDETIKTDQPYDPLNHLPRVSAPSDDTRDTAAIGLLVGRERGRSGGGGSGGEEAAVRAAGIGLLVASDLLGRRDGESPLGDPGGDGGRRAPGDGGQGVGKVHIRVL